MSGARTRRPGTFLINIRYLSSSCVWGTGRLIVDIAHQFKELADNAPVMIWRAGIDGSCDFFNKPWLEFTGRSLEQELGNG